MIEERTIHIAFVGHVDHGKSSILGRLLVETGSLSHGKLEQVQSYCERNAKTFEYAYLTDALEKEQSQGITIDAARCFIRSGNRKFLFTDTPGHLDFIKNMMTGSATADIALLIIDAKEGIKENTLRHLFLISFLNIEQIIVLVNKMDQVDYSQEAFHQISNKILETFQSYHLTPLSILPISAKNGDHFTKRSERMQWYKGSFLWQTLWGLSIKSKNSLTALRSALQGVYRFSQNDDTRRIYAATVTSGTLKKGDRIVFSPSQKEAVVHRIEQDPLSESASAGEATGFTLDSPLFAERGELISHKQAPPCISNRIKVSLFWMSDSPMYQGKRAILRVHTAKVECVIEKILTATDTTTLEQKKDKDPKRFDIVECVLSTVKPIAFDVDAQYLDTNRFVLIDGYQMIAAGKIIESLAQTEKTIRLCLLPVTPEMEQKLRTNYKEALFVSLTKEKSLDEIIKEIET